MFVCIYNIAVFGYYTQLASLFTMYNLFCCSFFLFIITFFKVLIAQEKMATNSVYVFQMKDSKYAYKSECRSCLEHSSRPTSTLWVNMLARGGQVIL